MSKLYVRRPGERFEVASKRGHSPGVKFLLSVALAMLGVVDARAEDDGHDGHDHHGHAHGGRVVKDRGADLAAARVAIRESKLPPTPAGVTELKFSDFFAHPVGDRGLTLTKKFTGLNGKRVRILGYMVRQGMPVAGMFLLSPVPVQTHEEEYGLADDLPPATLHVEMPEGERAAYTPGLLLLTGTLQVGNRVEKDGRVSVARLLVEKPAVEKSTVKGRNSRGKGAEELMAVGQARQLEFRSTQKNKNNQKGTSK